MNNRIYIVRRTDWELGEDLERFGQPDISETVYGTEELAKSHLKKEAAALAKQEDEDGEPQHYEVDVSSNGLDLDALDRNALHEVSVHIEEHEVLISVA